MTKDAILTWVVVGAVAVVALPYLIAAIGVVLLSVVSVVMQLLERHKKG
jgi:hypothetical protein